MCSRVVNNNSDIQWRGQLSTVLREAVLVMLMVVTVSMRVLGIAVRGGVRIEKEADHFDRVVSKIGTKMPNAHCHIMYIFIHVLVDSCNFISIFSDRTHE